MNAFLPFDSAQWWQLAGWTMVHFIWLGAAAAALAILCRLVLRNAAPNIRYAAALTCLLLLSAMPLAIATWLASNTLSLPAPEATPSRAATFEAAQQIDSESPTANGAHQGVIELNRPTPLAAAPASPHEQPIAERSALAKQPPISQVSGTRISFATLQRFVPYLPWLWLIGTPITFALLAMGVVGTKRLRQSSRTIDDSRITELLTRACAALQVRARVGLAVCDRIATPVLIGILRPMILLPPAALTGWTPDEIEMVLLHELAHVRRWDNLVNLLQRCIESLLFFHPAVWIISTWVRREREDCCDAIVVRRTERPHAYAELLVALAAQMPRSVLFHPVASSAMSSGPLHTRIRRILQLESDPMLISGKSFAVMLAGILAAATFTVLYVPTIGQAEESFTTSIEIDGIKLASLEREIADDPGKFTTAHLPYAVEFEKGASRFADGDNITILDIRGTSRTFEPGNVYQIKGKYTLGSRDSARLAAFTTAKKTADGKGPVWKIQATDINRGEGTFTLFLPMKHDGWPHVSFYPAGTAGSTFGGTYFGTGDSVLKKWWKDGDVIDKRSSTDADELKGRRVIKRLPADTNTGELITIIDSLIESGEAKGKAIVIALPSKTAVSQFEIAKAMRERHKAGKIADAATAWIAGDQIELIFEPAWLEEAHFATPEDFDVAERAWKELGVKFVPANDEELAHIRRGGTKGGLKALDLEDALNVKPPVIFTHFQSRALSTGIPDFASLNKALNALTSGRHGEMVVLQGMNKGGGIIQYSIRWPLGSEELSDLQRHMRPAAAPNQGLDPIIQKLAGFETGQPPTDAATTSATIDAPSHPKFPSLEDQKLADLAYKRLQLELEPIGDEDMARIKKFGYDGGLKVVGTSANDVRLDDILVGLHVWPTTSLADIAKILKRDDITELSPLKFYVVRPQADGSDVLVTGRISVQLDRKSGPQAFIDSMRRESNDRTESIPRDLFYYSTKAKQAGAESEATSHKQLDSLEPGSVIYFFHSQTSEPSIQMKPIVDGLAKRWPVAKVIEVEVGQDAALARAFNIDKVPTILLLQNGRVVQRLIGLQTAEDLDKAIASVSTPSANTRLQSPQTSLETDLFVLPSPEDEDMRPKSRRALPTAPASESDNDAKQRPKLRPPTSVPTATSSKESLRYDDNTFEEWRDLWKNELSTTKRTEAIKALAAFARAGYGKEATEAILDVAGEYDFNLMSNDPEGKLKTAVVNELLPESGNDDLAKYWLPDLASRLKQDPDQWGGLTWNLMGRLRTDDPSLLAIVKSFVADSSPDVRSTALSALIRSSKSLKDGSLTLDDQTGKLMTDALKSGEPMMVHAVLEHLLLYPQANRPGEVLNPTLIFQPELVPLLFHDEQYVRQRVRGLIQFIDAKDAPKVVEHVTAQLQGQNPEQRLAAIQALAVLGPNADAALPSLKKLVNSSSDKETLLATYIALQEINRKTNERQGAPYNVYLFVEGLDENEKNAVLEKIDAASPNFNKKIADESAKLVPQIQNFGGGGYSGGGFF
jgi:beta-lactamase regulating signal transducer with metallopeptidase domain